MSENILLAEPFAKIIELDSRTSYNPVPVRPQPVIHIPTGGIISAGSTECSTQQGSRIVGISCDAEEAAKYVAQLNDCGKKSAVEYTGFWLIPTPYNPTFP